MTISDKPRVWLDMDPGIDDSWALVVGMSQCDVQGISTVAGNVPLANTFGNAKRIMSVIGEQAPPIIPGADHPLLTPLVTAREFHGEGGVGAWEGGGAEEVPVGTVRVWNWWASHPEALQQTHLIATGPLTNLGVALLAHPELADRFASVTLMCGALPGTQLDKAQEFNVYVDPQAADLVFHWGKRVQLIGINVCHTALIPIADLKRLSQYGRVGEMLSRMLSFYSERSRGEGGDPGAFPIDDVVAVAAVARPEFFTWQELPLAVVREGPLRGTVVVSPVDLKRPPVRVAVSVDAAAFRNWVWESMEHYRPGARRA